MDGYRRHAIYWLPETGSALARLGAAWLGWDAEAGRGVARPDLPGLPDDAAGLPGAAPRYGFHATLKPPFRLAEGRDPAGLAAATEALADGLVPFDIPALAVRALGRFLALQPAAPCAALSDLAARCVAVLDPFRAPAGPAELARRRAAGLSATQEANLIRWGYPHVMEEFRFHLTLAGPLSDADRAAARGPLAAWFAPALDGPVPVRDIALMGEDARRAVPLPQAVSVARSSQARNALTAGFSLPPLSITASASGGRYAARASRAAISACFSRPRLASRAARTSAGAAISTTSSPGWAARAAGSAAREPLKTTVRPSARASLAETGMP
jgi:putative phosphonate metabolism protein